MGMGLSRWLLAARQPQLLEGRDKKEGGNEEKGREKGASAMLLVCSP